MKMFSYEEAAAWTGGEWTTVPKKEITGVMQDTRLLEPGMLYVAIEGERVDGHAFIAGAMERGAAGVLCLQGKEEPGFPCLVVPDTIQSLEDLARGYRKQLGGLMIGITGSSGKTTVKDLLASMFAERGSTCSTRGNWNNKIGLPLSMLSMQVEDDFGVFELGMNSPGEISHLAALAQPMCGLITSIGEAHLERLGSLQAIAEEKGALLSALPEDGLAILDVDSEWHSYFKSQCTCRTVLCSLTGIADIVGNRVEGEPRLLRVADHVRGRSMTLKLPLPGEHMRRNVLQSVALAIELGLGETEIQAGIQNFAPAPMRWQQSTVWNRTLINDAYNANPLSMRSSIRTFAEMNQPVEKWVVVGGMAELGEAEEELHRELGAFMDQFRFAGVIGVGPKAKWMCEEVKSMPVYPVETCGEAAEIFMTESGNGCALLLKGSRSEALERIEDLIQSKAQEVQNV
jgi:UDP-N-acetylmuramoyl-tripeptide--D-alanyl-D-alanine ligase